MGGSVYLFWFCFCVTAALPDVDSNLSAIVHHDHLDAALDEAEAEILMEKDHHFPNANVYPNSSRISSRKYVAPEVANLGELHEIVGRASERIAERFNIHYDKAKVLVEERAAPRPEFNANILCQTRNFQCNSNFKYRNVDGSCNNIRNPSFGLAIIPFDRLLSPIYRNANGDVRLSVTGDELPSPRIISSNIHPDVNRPNPFVTHMIVGFGQFIDHDFSSTPECQITQCCQNNNRECMPIRFPNSDPVYGRLGITCIDFCRSIRACNSQPRNQINQATAFLDGSQIYGNSVNEQSGLRSFNGGQLTFAPNSRMLPQDPQAANCGVPQNGNVCFKAGDDRVNENPFLTSMHTLFLREHNRVAQGLRNINRQWNEETLFQETKRIVVAEIQNIAYSEFLPVVLGSDVMNRNNLNLPQNGFTNYNANLRPNIINSFATAAYRFGHTLIQDVFNLFRSGTAPLATSFQNPAVINQQIDNVERILLGLTQQPAQSYENFMANAVTSHLFQTPGAQIGSDLASLNIQRGRDHGIPPYVEFRDFCGLSRPTTFDDLPDIFFSVETVDAFFDTYAHIDDIDLWPAGISEKSINGGIVGPTFACILATQFNRMLYADRFFFTHGSQAGSFTSGQLTNLRQRTLAGVICDNVDLASSTQLQRNVFLNPSQGNVAISCANQPKLNLNLWKP